MSKFAKLNFLLLGLIISVILIIGGTAYYHNQKGLITTQSYNDLRFIANEKANRIMQWLDERIDNTKNISYSPFFVEAVAKWMVDKNNLGLEGKILKRLSLIKENNDYENVILASRDGKIVLSLDKGIDQLDSVTASCSNRVLSNKEVILTDLYKKERTNKIYMDVIAPVVNNKGEVIALLISVINPNDYLYPLIQSWPTLSKSAETLIIRKDSDSVTFLNKLRHRKDSPLSLKLPITRYDLPAVKATTYTGNFEGKDYRGKDVLADLRHIDGTNWYMVTKVDADEILSELGYRTDVIIFAVIILIILSFSGTAFVYRSRQKNYYKELFDKEKDLHAAKEEFRTVLYSIGDGIITINTDGMVKTMNHVAEELTGWEEDEAAGMPIEKVFRIINESSKKEVESPVKKVLKEGTITGLANHTLLLSKDGRSTPIADSGAPIKSENGNVLGVVLTFRDQTEERHAQKLIEESRQRFLSLFTKMNEGVALHELLIDKNNRPVNYRIVDVNPQFEKILGISRLDAVGKLATEVYKTDKAPYLDEYSNVALSGKSYTFETYFSEMDKHFKISTTPWLRKGFATIFSDITEEKRAGEALNKRLFALTQPLENSADIKFSDLFNIDDLQRLQDSFAEATGVGSLITDPDGVPLTKPSNFCRLCDDIIRKTEKGAANCKRSDSSIGCYNPDGPTAKACLSGGLWDAGASIKVGGRHIANWLVGQVRNEATDKEKIMQYADTIGADHNEFGKALDEVTVMSSVMIC